MLVILSDLHLTDGTSSNRDQDGKDLFNVVPEAFEFFLRLVNDIAAKKSGIERVKFVYAGDVFDLLRTYSWFDLDEDQRPWAIPADDDKVWGNTRELLGKITGENAEALQWLSGSHPRFGEVFDVTKDIERVYVPGNHDRMLNLDETCRGVIREKLLGETGGNAEFKCSYYDDEHETVVRHGHEADCLNCEKDDDGAPDYSRIPIGDPMTTMLFARAGYLAGQHPDINEAAVRRFRDLDNIRPELAGVRYIQGLINEFDIRGPVDEITDTLVEDFEDLPFYQNWHNEHDRFARWDETETVQTVMDVLKVTGTRFIPARLVEKAASVEKIFGGERSAIQQQAAKILESETGARFCVLGHTHEAEHVPMPLRGKLETHYLNSGTFRTTIAQTFDGENFVNLQRLSFAIIYAPNEVKTDYNEPLFELWSGLRKRY